MSCTREEIRKARLTELIPILETYYPDMIKHVGHSICLKNNKSLYIKQNYSGYKDFATEETGNSIDFLIKYLNFTFDSAVHFLVEKGAHVESVHSQSSSFILPSEDCNNYRMFSYLRSRAIPDRVLTDLYQKGLIYQEAEHKNIIFINPEKNYLEIRGSYDYANGKGFHSCRKLKSTYFWYATQGASPIKDVYICESAIDAISLMVLMMSRNEGMNSAFVSIGGVSNQQTINRIKTKRHSILAVDNDEAGFMCRKYNHDLEYILPNLKDWNEDLKQIRKKEVL